MDVKDIADALREKLTPETWWDGRREWAPGKMCLGMALGEVLRQHDALMTYLDWERRIILPVIRSLFPDRNSPTIPQFNDQASYEDVMLVIKHLEER